MISQKTLRNVRGVSQDTTQTLLKAADGVMEKLVRNTASTPKLLLSQIELYIQFEQTYWYVGDINNALSYVSRSIDLSNEALKNNKNPDDRHFVLEHRYEGLMDRGNILRVLGDLDASLASFRMAKITAEQIIALKPDRDKVAWLRLERAYGRIGDVMRTSERFAEAEQEYRQAESIQTRFIEVNHEDVDWLGELSWNYNRSADNLLHITHHEGLMAAGPGRKPAFSEFENLGLALSYYEKGLEIRYKLTSINPKDTRNRRDLIWSLALTGMALLATDPEKAKQILDEALSEVNRALEEDPKNTELLRYQALTLNFKGDYFLIVNALPEALVAYNGGLSIRQKLSDTDPKNARWLRDLFYTLNRMVELYLIVGDATKAEDFRTNALQAWERVQPLFPTDHVLARTAAMLKERRG